MAYCMIHSLRNTTGKLKEGDTHYSSWFSAVCKFIGTFYRKYPNTELKGILHFLLQRLSAGDSLDLLVLKEVRQTDLSILHALKSFFLYNIFVSLLCFSFLFSQLLSKMGGCDSILYISHQQLECLAGGSVLRSETMGGANAEAIKNKSMSSTPLRDELINSGTAIPLLLLISQNSTRTLYGVKSNHLKLISYLYDTCQDVLMQFADFLLSGERIF